VTRLMIIAELGSSTPPYISLAALACVDGGSHAAKMQTPRLLYKYGTILLMIGRAINDNSSSIKSG
jgi:hypothetical protein